MLILIGLTLMHAVSCLGKYLPSQGVQEFVQWWVPWINMKVFSQQSWDLKNESCEIWREPSATYIKVQSHQLIFAIFKTSAPQRYTSTKLFKTLRPLQREVQRDPQKKGRRIVFQSDLNLIAVEGFHLNWQCLWGMSPVSTSQRPKKHAVASFMPIISWCQNWTLLHQSKCLEFIRWLR